MPALDVEKRERFIEAYVRHGNAAQAARDAGVPSKGARVTAHRWLRDPRVAQSVRQEVDRVIADYGPMAVKVLADLMLDPDVPPQVRAGCARDLLDRAGHIPPKRMDVSFDWAAKPLDRMTRAELEALAAGGPLLEGSAVSLDPSA
jgi:hypothetical protein